MSMHGSKSLIFKTLVQSSLNLLHLQQRHFYRNKTDTVCVTTTTFLSKVTAKASINKCMKMTPSTTGSQITLPRTKAQWDWCSIYKPVPLPGPWKNTRTTKAACLIPARLLTESFMSLPALPLYVPGKAAIATSETVTQGGGESYSSSFWQFCQAVYPLLHKLSFFRSIINQTKRLAGEMTWWNISEAGPS